MQPMKKIIHHEIPGKPWEVVVVECVPYTINICIVDYHNKFTVIKKTENLPADSLILPCKIIFPENGLSKK